MAEHHGATTIKEWLDDFAKAVQSDRDIKTSAGAEPGREYAYLEWHDDEDRHSILLFKMEDAEGELGVHSYRFDGNSKEVRERVDSLVHGEH
ncbi:MAG: hypothetical protein R3223_10125 [Longimicrobiales bacterium]|nr:hypothetical protein [Longimicrobiales bacterium]